MFISFKITHLYDHSYNFHTSIYAPFIPHTIVIILPLIVIISLVATGTLPIMNMVTILKTQTTNNFIGMGEDGGEDGNDGGAGGDDGGGGVTGVGSVCDDGSPNDCVRVVDGTGSTDPVVGRGVPVTDDG
jgi:hypothetical protein